MTEPLESASPTDPAPSPVGSGRPPVVLVIEAMREEQVALLAEDLVEVLVRRAARQPIQVASEPP